MEKSLGQPKIDDVKFEEGSDFSFKATFEVFPELDPHLIDGDEIEQTNCKIGATDIKEMIATLREQRKSWKESAKAASKKGDRVTINFDGFIDEEAFEGGKGEDHALVLGSGSMIPGFEDGIIGMKKGDAKTLKSHFQRTITLKILRARQRFSRFQLQSLSVGRSQQSTKSLSRPSVLNLAKRRLQSSIERADGT